MAVAEERRLSAGGSVLLLTGMGAVSHVLGFFYRVALSRMVGAEVMGLYQLVMPVFSVVLSCTAVGLTAAVSNLTARRLALEDRRGADQVLRTCLWWMLGLLLPVGAALIWWSDGVSVWLLGDARTQLGLILLVPCAAFTGVENLHKHAFYGAGTVGAPAVVELLEQVVRAAAVLGLLVLFLPQYPERVVGLIVAGMVMCEVFSSCALVLLYHRRRRRQRLTGEGLPRIVNRRHFDRLAGLLSGGRIAVGGQTDPEGLRIAPTVLVDVPEGRPVLAEEIFGPILPVLLYRSLPELVEAQRQKPRPLALYLFTRSRSVERAVLEALPFGGGCVNDTVVHLADPRLPFGGVGNSGMGACHGKAGFDAFTHEKSVLKKGRLDIPVRYPPYGKKHLGILKKLM